ncbi:MAG: phosphotransferase [Chloroflexi bacterium]|nr:phosphotransferase [Chloroflexota bacterium]
MANEAAPRITRGYELLHPLLDHLTAAAPLGEASWRQWQIARVGGGASNLVYHVTRVGSAHPEDGDLGELAVKFTIRDGRDRAGREYGALWALQRAGLHVAPEPVLLERERFAQPVVVQSWLSGPVSVTPPVLDEDWLALVQHFAAVHSIALDNTGALLSPAVLTMDSAAAGSQRIHEQLARTPPSAQSAVLRDLVERAARTRWPEWRPPALALCRCDPNTTNFVRRPNGWASVDWENSGRGDPAFEIADLMTHPTHVAVPASRWDWLIEAYCTLRTRHLADQGARHRADSTFTVRIRTYHRLMLVWWVVRIARALYEVPRGLDQRLAARPATWQADTQDLYDRYVQRAQEAW